MESHPLSNLKLSPHNILETLQGRSECPKCQKSRKYYCYTCYVPVDLLLGKIPCVKLPIKIDIIKHPSEVDGKSTCAHAKVLANDDVNIYTYPCIPDYLRDGSVVLVFPNDDSCTLEELAQKIQCMSDTIQHSKGSYKINELSNAVKDLSHEKTQDNGQASAFSDKMTFETNKQDNNEISVSSNTENENIPLQMSDDSSGEISHVMPHSGLEGLNNSVENEKKRKLECNTEENISKKYDLPVFRKAVFIDSTWNQTYRISTDERLKGLPCIVLKDRESKFWRHQKENPASYLSTVEAVYYLVRDYHDLFISSSYDGEYDDLMFFFMYMYNKIQGLYQDRPLKADIQRHNDKLKNK